jgi:hypothetical protein
MKTVRPTMAQTLARWFCARPTVVEDPMRPADAESAAATSRIGQPARDEKSPPMITRQAQLTRSISQYAAITAATIILAFNPVAVNWLGLFEYRRYSFMIDVYGIMLILTHIFFLYKTKTYFIYFAIFLISLFPIYAFAVEIWLIQRQLVQARPPTLIENTHQSDPALGWAPIPNAVGRHVVAGNFDVEYRFDKLGRKKIDQDPNVTRTIHVFGDSYIFGHGVSNADTALNMLAKDLKGIVNIQNYGVMGYGLEQIYVRLEQNASEIGPHDIVLFVPTASSLARNVIDKRYVCENFFAGHMTRSLQINRTKRTWINLQGRCDYFRDELLARSRLPFGTLYQWYHHLMIENQLTQNADRILGMAKNVAVQRGAQFILLFMARPSECKAGRHDTDWHNLKISFDSLLIYCPKDIARVESFSFPTEGHLNPAGNAWLADALRQYLAKRGIAGNHQGRRETQ